MFKPGYPDIAQKCSGFFVTGDLHDQDHRNGILLGNTAEHDFAGPVFLNVMSVSEAQSNGVP